MCGRYTVIRLDQIVRIIHNVTIKVDLSLEMPRWNVAPGQEVPIITHRPTPTLEKARWGLIPSWARDPAIANRLINARAETVAEKPAYRAAFKARRCALPADGFYEWRKNSNGSKTPMYLRLRTRQPFVFAGLWETWHAPAGEVLTTCTIITTTANALVAPIHNRMPVILPPEHILEWIDPATEHPEGMLQPLAADLMEAYPVSTRVNRPQSQGEDLIEEVEAMGELF